MTSPIAAMRAIILAHEPTVILLTDTFANPAIVRHGSASQIDRLPYVLLWSIMDRPYHHLGGRLGERMAIVQVDVYADSMVAASAIAESIGDAAAGFWTGKSDTVDVLSLLEQDTRVTDTRNNEAADKPTATVQTDYRLIYRKP